MISLVRLLLILYSLSIAGYALVDGGHEVLHALKYSFHHHVHQNAHQLHDHQPVFQQEQFTEKANEYSLKHFGFLLFYQAQHTTDFEPDTVTFSENGLFEKIRIAPTKPLTPPPLG